MANPLPSSSISFLLTFAFVLVIFVPFSCDSATLRVSRETRYRPRCRPLPPPPMNGEIRCRISTWQGGHSVSMFNCTASCREGFKFPGGETKLESICNDNIGKWSPFYNFPECSAESKCRNKCQNGGVCQTSGNCACTKGFRGPFCEYSLSLCNPSSALGFNGNWKCDHPSNGESVCTLKCPPGTSSASPTQETYRCTMDGKWTPPSPPICIWS